MMPAFARFITGENRVMRPQPQFLSVGAGSERREIAVLAQAGKGPPVV